MKEAGRNGFALILVVWLLVLIGTIGAYLVVNGRAESTIAFNVRAAAAAEALADAGIARVVFNQEGSSISNRWKLDGAAHRIVLPAGEIEIRLADETQKINPNLATDKLLAALFEVCGTDQATARHLGAAVADWVSADGAPREGGAKLEQYRAAGKSYGPPNAPAQTVDELQLVLGMTPAIFASVRPYLTIHTGTAAPDGKSAPLKIQRALALAKSLEGSEEDSAAAPQTPAPQTPAPQTPAPQNAGALQQAPSEERIIEALVTGRSRAGGIFVRHAVLRLEPDSPNGYAVLDWRRGSRDDTGSGHS